MLAGGLLRGVFPFGEGRAVPGAGQETNEGARGAGVFKEKMFVC